MWQAVPFWFFLMGAMANGLTGAVNGFLMERPA